MGARMASHTSLGSKCDTPALHRRARGYEMVRTGFAPSGHSPRCTDTDGDGVRVRSGGAAVCRGDDHSDPDNES
jgi:hypothetical protein